LNLNALITVHILIVVTVFRVGLVSNVCVCERGVRPVLSHLADSRKCFSQQPSPGPAVLASSSAALVVYARPLGSALVLPLYSSSLPVSACSCSSSRPPATDLVFPHLGSGIDLRSGLLLAHFIFLSFCVRLTVLARDFFQIDSSLKSCPGFTFHGQDFFFFSVCAARSAVSSSLLLFSTRVERPDQRAWSSVHDSVGRYYSCQISVLFSRIDACSQARVCAVFQQLCGIVFLLFFHWAVGLRLDRLECTQPASNSCLCAAGLSWTLVLSAHEVASLKFSILALCVKCDFPDLLRLQGGS
jgi:hypothetical protein